MFPVRLLAGRQDGSYTLTLRVSSVGHKAKPRIIEKRIPAGQGVYEAELNIPTDQEGVFDLTVTEGQGRAVDRMIQYLVVDTKQAPPTPTELRKELVTVIDCTAQRPDYASSETRLIRASFGAYRESGPKGVFEYREDADFFAYVLN